MAPSAPEGAELVTCELARLEITRTLLRAGTDHRRVPFLTGLALRGVCLVDVTSTVLARAAAYRIRRLGRSTPFICPPQTRFTPDFVTYDLELAAAAADLGFPVVSPS